MLFFRWLLTFQCFFIVQYSLFNCVFIVHHLLFIKLKSNALSSRGMNDGSLMNVWHIAMFRLDKIITICFFILRAFFSFYCKYLKCSLKFFFQDLVLFFSRSSWKNWCGPWHPLKHCCYCLWTQSSTRKLKYTSSYLLYS